MPGRDGVARPLAMGNQTCRGRSQRAFRLPETIRGERYLRQLAFLAHFPVSLKF